MFFGVDALNKDGADANTASVRMNFCGSRMVEVSENGMRRQTRLQLTKTSFTFRSPFKGNALLEEACQRIRDVGKSTNKPAEVRAKP